MNDMKLIMLEAEILTPKQEFSRLYRRGACHRLYLKNN